MPASTSGMKMASNFDDPYAGVDRTESIDMSELSASHPDASYGRDNSLDMHRQRSESQTHLAPTTSLPPYPPAGARTPIHPGAQVAMTPEAVTPAGGRSRAGSPARYGRAQTEKGYRSQSHSRAGSRDRLGGYGNWTGPAGGASPYGQLGESRPGSPGADSQWTNDDNPKSNKFSRFCLMIYNSTFLVRWFLYIVPVLALLWIPGIVWLAGHHGYVWSVGLIYWSVWLSVVWCGWWGAALVTRTIPGLLKSTIGVVAPELKHYILYVQALQFYLGAAAWGFVIWISFLPLVSSRQINSNSSSTLTLFAKFLFGIFIVLVLLLAEKLIIQVVAHNFHKKSYEDRILVQKEQVRYITRLYMNSHDIGRSDTLDGAMRPGVKRLASADVLKKAVRGAKKVAQTATSVVGTVASEIAGEQLLQPDSPQSMVLQALSSANKSRQLAKRLYYSFCPAYRKELLLEDITRCFKKREEAEAAFATFDRDGNGDVSMEEMEMACLDVHKERLNLTNSMRDVDSAVGKLDGIIMSVWWVIAILVVACVVDTSFETLIASAGTTILGLSWLIGTTAQELLSAIIFVFVKHSYDVGDRIEFDTVQYTVLEIHLLSTIFKRYDGTVTQAPHNQMTLKTINNMRRSGPVFESYSWDVDFGTSFEMIEALRAKMLEFVEAERRDYLPAFDITVKDFAAQGLLTLSANINYRSNWQNAALKAQRRNKWICALKLAMASLKVFGPGGAGNPAPDPADPTPYMQVPYKKHDKYEPEKAAEEKQRAQAEADEQLAAVDGIQSRMTDRRAPMEEQLEDEADEEAYRGRH